MYLQAKQLRQMMDRNFIHIRPNEIGRFPLLSFAATNMQTHFPSIPIRLELWR